MKLVGKYYKVVVLNLCSEVKENKFMLNENIRYFIRVIEDMK